MKCVICKSGDIAERMTEEEIRVGSNIVFVSVKALVCPECGEKYYNRAQMKKIRGIWRGFYGRRRFHWKRLGIF